MLCHVQLLVTPWTVALQAPLSIEFSRQEYWSGLPFSTPGDLPDLGVPKWCSVKRIHLPVKNTVTKNKNTLEGINRLDHTEEHRSDLKE